MKNSILKRLWLAILIIMVQSVTKDQTGYAANGIQANKLKVTGTLTELSVSVTAPSCPERQDGVADLTIEGDDQPYRIFWSDGTTTEDLSGKPAGNYRVVVAGQSGELLEANIEIPNATPLMVSAVASNVTCFKGMNGNILTNIEGGTLPYTISCNGIKTGHEINHLAAGLYSVIVEDGYGCQSEQEIEIREAAIDFRFTTKDVTCNGASDGAIEILPVSGNDYVNYLWSDGTNGPLLQNVSKGTYELTLEFENGCRSSYAFAVAEPENLALSLTSTDASCEKGGTASVFVSGGEEPYLYNWSDGSEISDLDRLEAGDYTIEVTDAKLCKAKGNVKVNGNHSKITLLLTSVSANCATEEDGSIDLYVSGGIQPYTYEWSNGYIGEDLLLVKPGDYSIQVTDASGCSQSTNITVESPEPFTASISEFSKGCDLNGNGLTVMPAGGIRPYQYLWSNGARQSSVGELAAGNYAVTVTDANGCQVILQKEITEYIPVSIGEKVQHPSSPGASNGSVDIVISGGIAPYVFEWSNGSNSEDLENLLPGKYELMITDATGCTSQFQFNIGVGYGEEAEMVASNSIQQSRFTSIQLQVINIGTTGQATMVSITAPTDDQYMISLYDLTGRKLENLFEGMLRAGEVRTMDAYTTNYISGVYLVKAVSTTQIRTLKLNILN